MRSTLRLRNSLFGLFVTLFLLVGLLPTQVLAQSRLFITVLEQVQGIYLAYYGRSGDPAGVNFWVERQVASGGDASAIIEAFGTSAEAEARYAGKGDEEIIDMIYMQLYGRMADDAGMAFYLGQLQSGALTRQSMALDILNGTQGDDIAVVRNKIEASQFFTDRTEETDATFTAAQIPENEAILAGVTEDPDTLFTARTQTNGFMGVYASPDARFGVTILHINDHHSHAEPNTGASLTFDGVDTDVETGGFPRVVTKIEELAGMNDNVLKLHAGDAITGTIFYTVFKGASDADLMNLVCFDAFVLGNHEFDDSDAGLAQFIGFLNDGPAACPTPVLAANVIPEVGTPLMPDMDTSLIEPYVIKEVGDQQIGIIGIEIAGKTQNSSSPLDSTQFLDERETSQEYIDLLTAMGVDKIVILSHFQYDNDIEMAQNLSGVDVIVDGDSHSLLGDVFADFGLNPVGPYPTEVFDLDANKVCIVQAWQFSEVVGELHVDFDPLGNVLSCEGTPHLLLGDTFQQEDLELEGDARQAVLDIIDATPELSIVMPDPTAQAIVDGFAAELDDFRFTVVGSASEDFCLERIPGGGRSSICPVEQTQANGGDIQQSVTEAFLQRSFEADVAIQNAGGVRIDVPAGEITVDTVFTLLPFANTLVNLDMTGAEIKQVLEEAVSNFQDGDGSTGSYPYASNLRWHVDLSQPFGSRFSNIEIRRKGTSEWVPLQDGDQVKVVTNSFIAAGRDGYLTFGEVSEDGRVVDTFIDYAQAYIDYLQQDLGGAIPGDPILDPPPVVSPPACEDYSTQSFINADGVLQEPDPLFPRACEQ